MFLDLWPAVWCLGCVTLEDWHQTRVLKLYHQTPLSVPVCITVFLGLEANAQVSASRWIFPRCYACSVWHPSRHEMYYFRPQIPDNSFLQKHFIDQRMLWTWCRCPSQNYAGQLCPFQDFLNIGHITCLCFIAENLYNDRDELILDSGLNGNLNVCILGNQKCNRIIIIIICCKLKRALILKWHEVIMTVCVCAVENLRFSTTWIRVLYIIYYDWALGTELCIFVVLFVICVCFCIWD